MYILKIIFWALIFTGLSFSSIIPPKAQAEDRELINISGGISEFFESFTQYVSKDINHSDQYSTIQQSFDRSNNSEIYLSVWANNADSNYEDQDNTELDFYFGFKKDLQGMTIDLGGFYYTNPGTLYYGYTSAEDTSRYDYFEYEFGLSYEFPLIEMSGTLYHTPDYFEANGSSTHVSYEAQIPVLKSLAITGYIGYQWVANETQEDLPDYLDWNVGLTYPINEFDLSLQYAKSDLSSSNCLEGCDSSIAFNVSRSF